MYDMDIMHGYRWSLMFQRELPAKWVASVGYTGAQYYNLLVQSIGHIRRWEGFPNQPAEGPKFFPVGAGRVNPAWADMRLQHTSADANYHGLTVGLQKRLSRGFDGQFSYTYAKSIDQGSGVSSGGDNFFQGQRTVTGFWDLYLDRSLSAFDIRNNFTANFTYQLPGDTLDGFVGALAKGWRVNGILMVADGFPLSVSGATTAAVNRVGNADGLRANLVEGGNNNPVLGGPDKYFDPSQFSPVTPGFFGTAGRGTLIAPGVATFDLGLSKSFGVYGAGDRSSSGQKSSTCSTARTSVLRAPASSTPTGRRIPTSVGSPARAPRPDRSSWVCASCSDPATSTLTVSIPTRGGEPPPFPSAATVLSESGEPERRDRAAEGGACAGTR